MKNRIKYIHAVLYLTAFLWFALQLFCRVLEYKEGKMEYRSLIRTFSDNQSEAEKNTAGEMGEMGEISEEYLRGLNPDYLFWLSIPGTSINYPVVRSTRPGYYLNHTFQKTVNSCGSLFVQAGITGLDKGNTVIYGHNMKDGTMFSELKKYRDKDFFKDHKKIWIFEKKKWLEGEIFSCQLKEEQDLQCHQTEFSNVEEKKEFLNRMKESSLYSILLSPSAEMPVITLSTCYGHSKRMIVQAVLMCYTE